MTIEKNTFVKAEDMSGATVYGKIDYNKEGIKGICLRLQTGMYVKIARINK